ncbi:MAG: peroxidase family protein [Alphaproteobacteria bacterium]
MTLAIRGRPAGAACLGQARAAGAGTDTGTYTRMFADLPPLAGEAARLAALGQPGAACDRGETEGDGESTVAAGWPFFGQLIAHDITADRSPLGHLPDAPLANARAARLDLECLYGAGPTGSPYLYDAADPAKFLLGPGGCDVPRNAQGVALVGDPRNDAHLFVNQMHVALLRAHNRLVDDMRAMRLAEGRVFAAARVALVWHYQWLVLEDYLPGLVGPDLAAGIAAGAIAVPVPPGLSIPLEFADAAFRYGHAQVRQTYRIRPDAAPLTMFPDLVGFRAVGPERRVDFGLLFDAPGGLAAQRAPRLDERLPKALVELPEAITGVLDQPTYRSLAARDLERGRDTALPSGEAVARAFGLDPLPAESARVAGWEGETPLWLYILREAAVLEDGQRLGPVGGRIVAGTLTALIDRDPESYRAAAPDWRPTLPAASGNAETFTLLDLLRAGD